MRLDFCLVEHIVLKLLLYCSPDMKQWQTQLELVSVFVYWIKLTWLVTTHLLIVHRTSLMKRNEVTANFLAIV